MNRLLIGVVAGFVVAGTASADIAPPKGFKRIALDNKVTTEKAFPDYAFYLVSGGDKVEAVKLDPKTPLVISGEGRGGRYRFVQLVAVPKDAAKKYDTEKAFHEAVATGKVAGMARQQDGFATLTEVKDSDPRKTATAEFKLEKIDAKEGLVVAAVGAGKANPKKGPPKPEEEEEGGGGAAYAPRGGVWVAAVAATVGLVFGGLWLAGRNRKPG